MFLKEVFTILILWFVRVRLAQMAVYARRYKHIIYAGRNSLPRFVKRPDQKGKMSACDLALDRERRFAGWEAANSRQTER